MLHTISSSTHGSNIVFSGVVRNGVDENGKVTTLLTIYSDGRIVIIEDSSDEEGYTIETTEYMITDKSRIHEVAKRIRELVQDGDSYDYVMSLIYEYMKHGIIKTVNYKAETEQYYNDCEDEW